jgi:hypothetical protein
MDGSRLAHVDPGLLAALEAATEAGRRRAAAAVARWAADRTGLPAPPPDPAGLDDDYFELQRLAEANRAPEGAALEAFAWARAASAAEFAAAGEAAEAVYEALAVADDPAAVRAVVAAALAAEPGGAPDTGRRTG